MIAAVAATMLIVFLFIAFVLGSRYAGGQAVPAGAVSIQEIGLKTVDGEESILLMGHDGWAYAFDEDAQLFLVPPAR